MREVVPCEDLGDAAFDAVVSWSVMEHVSQDIFDYQLAILKRALRPGGFLVFQVSPLYYSAFGSHFVDRQTPWQHLEQQTSLFEAKMREACLESSISFEKHWSTFVTLNRFTSEDFLDALSNAGFDVLDVYSTRMEISPPDRIVRIFKREILMEEQILVVARTAGAPGGKRQGRTA